MKIIQSTLFDDLFRQAAAAARRRSNYNIHESSRDPIQRYFVAVKLGSYFRPHRHRGKSELALILRGAFDIVLFDDRGIVTDRRSFGPATGNLGFELPPDIWHTWMPMVDDSLFFEVKEGPYDPASSIEFAPWSPPEGDERVAGFMERLKELRNGDNACRCTDRA